MSDAFMNVLGALTAASSVAMCLSPTPSIYRIYREKKIVDVSILPLVSLWANSHVWCVLHRRSIHTRVLHRDHCLHHLS